jgi:hypothetical protein
MIRFKTPRIEAEFRELPSKNKRLFVLATAAGHYSMFEFKKEITITSLYRTPEENAELYSPNKEPFNKPHTLWEAIDLRSTIYTESELKKLLHFLNLWTAFDGKRSTAFCHTVLGGAQHFHVQTNA